jgi:hypothetical protein
MTFIMASLEAFQANRPKSRCQIDFSGFFIQPNTSLTVTLFSVMTISAFERKRTYDNNLKSTSWRKAALCCYFWIYLTLPANTHNYRLVFGLTDINLRGSRSTLPFSQEQAFFHTQSTWIGGDQWKKF